MYFRFWVLVFCFLYSVGFLFGVAAKAGAVVAVDDLVKSLAGENAACRKAAAERISKLITRLPGQCPIALKVNKQSEISIEKLLKLVEHKDVLVRLSAVAVLGKMRDVSAVPTLKRVLQDKNGLVRSAVVNVLGRLDGKAALPVIRKALGDRDPEVQMKSIYVYGDFGGRDAVLPLTELLKNKDLNIVDAAATSLSRLAYKEKIRPLLKVLGKIKDNRRKYVFLHLLQRLMKTL